MTLATRLVLLASALVVLAAAGVGGTLTWSAMADLEAAQRDRGLAVARDFAHRAEPLLKRGDRAGLRRLVDSGFEIDDLARVEVRTAFGRILASKDVGSTAPAMAPTARTITGPPDVDGIREAVGLVEITLTSASVDAQRDRSLRRAVWATGGVAAIGLSLAIGLGLRLARPLRQAADAADAVAAGDYADADALPADGAPREIARLSEAFRGAVNAVADRERTLQTLNADLHRTQAARDAMTHMLVHDLKGPLGNVVTLMSILQTARLDADDLELVDEGRARCESLLALIGDLLDIGRLEFGKLPIERRPVDVRALFADAVSSVRHLAEARGVVLTQEIEPELPLFEGDARLLGRVLTNLLINAIRHGKTPVEVRAQAGEGVVLSVKDGGSGPPADQVEQIFETYASGAGGERRGSGLGLAFVKLAVHAHGGRITVDGATFSVHLEAV